MRVLNEAISGRFGLAALSPLYRIVRAGGHLLTLGRDPCGGTPPLSRGIRLLS